MPKPGRPTKKDSINRAGLQLCYGRGFTDAEVALALQITNATLTNWKKKDPKFFAALKDWKLTADHEVERSLYQRAIGGTWGDRTYAPDPTSMIFWLKNRQPARWRDKQEIEHSGDFKINIVQFSQEDNANADGGDNSK